MDMELEDFLKFFRELPDEVLNNTEEVKKLLIKRFPSMINSELLKGIDQNNVLSWNNYRDATQYFIDHLIKDIRNQYPPNSKERESYYDFVAEHNRNGLSKQRMHLMLIENGFRIRRVQSGSNDGGDGVIIFYP